jgi:hypothetical protein
MDFQYRENAMKAKLEKLRLEQEDYGFQGKNAAQVKQSKKRIVSED